MPTLKLNRRQKVACYNILSGRKGAGARSICKALHKAFDMDGLEDLQDANTVKIEELVESGKLRSKNENISKKLAAEHGITIFDWDEEPEEVAVDMTALEQARKAFASELEKEDNSNLSGGDWRIDEIKEELDRAYEVAKAASKSDGKVDTSSGAKAKDDATVAA